MRRRLGSHPLPGALLALAVAASLGLGGCGSLRIHRPQDLAHAQQAQTQFRAAELAQTVAAERTRLDQVLAQELDLVEKHTLARRDARLLYIIGEGDRPETWDFLEKDVDKRLKELGIANTDELKTWLKREERAKARLPQLESTAGFYETERQNDPSLPALGCPQLPGIDPPAEGTDARDFWDDYEGQCKRYLADRQGKPLANGDAIEAMTQAKQAAQDATRQARQDLQAAQKAFAEALKTSGPAADRQPVRDAAEALIRRADSVRSAVDAFIQDEDDTALADLGLNTLASKLGQARSTLSAMDLSAVVGDLSAVPAVAKLEATRSEVVAGLSATLGGETATRVFDSLQAIGVALQGPSETPVTAMVLKQRQLNLDIEAARHQEAFFDRTVALLKGQEAAFRDELGFLGQAELRRQEIVEEGCLSNVKDKDSELIKHLFTDQDPKIVKCKELVFRMLIEYSAAWTLGRVRSEQIDYQLIALHHESALDTSDTAFQKWAGLLELPIDQLVSFSRTGLKPEDLVNPVVNVLGLGAIAAGVN